MIKQSELKDLLNYNEKTGQFFWVHDMCNGKIKAGSEAGCLDDKGEGYIRIKVKGKLYLAQRLAFLWMEGYIPEFVDHDDHVRHNNKWVNLNSATSQDNNKNHSLHKNNKSGVCGVSKEKGSEKWHARIKVNYENKRLKSTLDFFEAVCARKSAENRYSFHENHGKVAA